MLETVTTAVVCLFQAHSALIDQVPSLGYIPRVFSAMMSKNNAVPKAGIQVVHQLAQSEVTSPIYSFNKIKHNSHSNTYKIIPLLKLDELQCIYAF